MEIILKEAAYFRWQAQMATLAALAMPESWQFKAPKDERDGLSCIILLRYINTVFKALAIEHNNATTKDAADRYICVRDGYVCFHTGLMTRNYKDIYAYLEKNRLTHYSQPWVLKGFGDDAWPLLQKVEILPRKPFEHLSINALRFDPNWPVRVNINHMIDTDNFQVIPEDLQAFPNIALLLRAGVEVARESARFIPSLAVPHLHYGQLQYLLPLCLYDPEVPDLAMTINPMDGYYIGAACLSLEMAYSSARILGRPTAPWLVGLVE